jgi:hypothetical protein
VKSNPRCDHKEGDRRCPDSAGYRIRQLTFGKYAEYAILPGRFCLKHSGHAANRVPFNRLPLKDR